MRGGVPYGSRSPWASPPASGGDPSPSNSSSSSSLSSSSSYGGGAGGEGIRRMVAETPVLVVGTSGCCMCHVARRLLQGLGVNPAVCEVGSEAAAAAISDWIAESDASSSAAAAAEARSLLPAVFIGGRLVGGVDRLMATHISGELVPILKDAGALWL